ncbi:MAG: YgaP family membrane protein [Nitrospirota bacterium]
MQKNVGGLDRFYRFGIGFLSLALTFVTGSILLKIIFALVALLGIATAFTGYCPLNAKFGVDTTKRKTR